MADTSIRHTDRATGAYVEQLFKDVGSGKHAAAAVLVGSDGLGVGSLRWARPTVTVDTAAYVDLDCIGGIITLADFVAISGGAAEIHSIEITELGAQKPPCSISFYKETPAGGTYTDNAGLVLDATDVASRTGPGPIQIVAGDYKAHGTHQVASLLFTPFAVECAVTSLFMLIQADGPYDAVAATDFKVRIGYKRIG